MLFVRTFLHRHEPAGRAGLHLKSGIGAIIALVLVGALSHWTGLPFLLAPFGASVVLLFGQPQSPLSQPANVLGGYLTAVGVSALLLALAPDAWWVAAVAVGASLALMLMLRVTHPPAGAIPLVAFATHLPVTTLLFVVIAGAFCLVGTAFIYHRLPPRVSYPRQIEMPKRPAPVGHALPEQIG